ncbi:AI-2E family transporter [Lacrimispora algidixylanolytica]|uniref:AI-2E family transporter n=1 Tax=Lacrimispora algidixylanolytica TaxID=94868 RepID=A0A419SVM6_9FIRM|nr:AI-2E family transporter [Lacrimispora algidixylanolytica]RKD29272.1 AI-2E family transporter [Lacrimispora algidixylanolytica]
MNRFDDIVNNTLAKKILSVILLALFMYLFRGMFNQLLLIFIITFILGQLQKYIYDKVNARIKVSRKLITILMYLVILLIFTICGIVYIPKVTQQLFDIVNLISKFDLNQVQSEINISIINSIPKEQIDGYIRMAESHLLGFVATAGTFSINLVLSFLISFLFLLERDEILGFLKQMENSKVSFLYEYFVFYGKKFLNSFGKVIELQIVIAFINSLLSVLALTIMGFPQTLGLGAMIFILGLIPVAGVIISLVPLTIIAFNIGGAIKIIEVIVMIVILHSLETYVLNPKLMSAKTKIPVFLVFLILLVSEHYIGVWGLLFGIPLFMFFLDILDIKVKDKT